MPSVHVRINDTATGRPTAVRAFFLDAGGLRAPLGRLGEFATGPGEDVGGHLQLGSERWCYLDGACEINLAPGPITVALSKGFEYAPVRETMVLGPGKLALRLAIARWIDLRTEGWYAGDSRCHAISPHAALLEAAGEDLAIVNLLARAVPARERRPATLENLLAFSGMEPALQCDGHVVVVNSLNVHLLLGTVSLLNCHRTVYPLRFGANEPDDWSVADWCDQCHRKRGLVVWADLPRLTPDHPQGEALAALLTHRIDAFEVSRFAEPEPAVLGDYYRLLDCGVRVPLVGGSGKECNTVALGAVRTYARLLPGETFSCGAWIEAIRAGRTFITNGPLLRFTVDDLDPGSVIALPQPCRAVRLRVEVRSNEPFDELELLVNGTVIAAKSASGNRQAALLEVEHVPKSSAWIVARCWSRSVTHGQCAYAHSSPVYVLVEGTRLAPDRSTAEPLLAVLDRTSQWIAGDARCPTEKARMHLAEMLTAGRDELLRRIRQ